MQILFNVSVRWETFIDDGPCHCVCGCHYVICSSFGMSSPAIMET